MKLGFACSDTDLIRQAECFYNEFAAFEEQSHDICCDEEFIAFVDRIMVPVKNIFAFKRHVLHLLVTCEIGGYNYPLLIDHISREAMYFHKLLGKIQNGTTKHPVDSIVSDNVFWLRHMADHSYPNNDLNRFEKDVTAATTKIRDFKKAARDLIASCKVVSLIPPLLADHVLREAEYFLQVLEEIQQDLTCTAVSPVKTADF